MAFLATYTSQQPIDDFGLAVSSVLYSAKLGATTNETLIVPASAGSFKAVIKVSAEVWFAIGRDVVAVIPASPTIAATNSEMLLPYFVTCREVQAGTYLNFIAPAASTDISIIFYALQTNG